MKKYVYMTGMYSLLHFIVDFSCAYLIFSKLSDTRQWLICLLIYNFCAFAMQMPLGLLADILNINRIIAASGCILILLSPIMESFPILLCALAGLGNALFHIGAGKDVLCGSRQRFSALGIFVSPGAIGLYFGMSCGKSDTLPILAVILVLTVAAAVTIFIVPLLYDKERMKAKPFSISINGDKTIIAILICLFIVVCLRSYIGMTLSFPWKGEGHYALMLLSSVVLGKALGGLLADRFGAIRVSLITLSLCAVLFFLYKSPVCGILAVLLFNMTMPITLGTVAKLFPSATGFGFGLLTFGLFIGFLPVINGIQNILFPPFGYAVICVVSACLLYFGLKEPQYAA